MKDAFGKESEFIEGIEKAIQEIRSLKPFQLELLLKSIDEAKELLRENRGFIDDNEAAMLSWTVAGRIVEIRSRMNSLIDNFRALIITCKNYDEPQKEQIIPYIFPVIRL